MSLTLSKVCSRAIVPPAIKTNSIKKIKPAFYRDFPQTAFYHSNSLSFRSHLEKKNFKAFPSQIKTAFVGARKFSSTADFLNQQNYEGDTALHLAVKKNEIKICRLLLSSGANPNIINKKGMTPLDIVLENYLSAEDFIFSSFSIQNIETKLNYALNNDDLIDLLIDYDAEAVKYCKLFK